jgi:hypothetical protein
MTPEQKYKLAFYAMLFSFITLWLWMGDPMLVNAIGERIKTMPLP